MDRDRLEENVRSWYYKRPIREADTSMTSGIYNVPVEIGLKKWEKNPDGSYDMEGHDVHTIKKDKSPKIGGFLKLLSTIIKEEVSKT
jgi:hypothetical protein